MVAALQLTEGSATGPCICEQHIHIHLNLKSDTGLVECYFIDKCIFTPEATEGLYSCIPLTKQTSENNKKEGGKVEEERAQWKERGSGKKNNCGTGCEAGE